MRALMLGNRRQMGAGKAVLKNPLRCGGARDLIAQQVAVDVRIAHQVSETDLLGGELLEGDVGCIIYRHRGGMQARHIRTAISAPFLTASA